MGLDKFGAGCDAYKQAERQIDLLKSEIED